LLGRSDFLRIFAIAPYPPDNPYHHKKTAGLVAKACRPNH